MSARPAPGYMIFPDEFYQWLTRHPVVWVHPDARRAMGRITAGSPGWETDPEIEQDGPDGTNHYTGNRVLYDPRIDVWDQAIAAVCVAGWQYAVALGKDGPALAAYQATKDAEALTTLLGRVEAGEITMADAEDAIRAEIRRQAKALKVDISYVDEPLEAEIGLP